MIIFSSRFPLGGIENGCEEVQPCEGVAVLVWYQMVDRIRHGWMIAMNDDDDEMMSWLVLWMVNEVSMLCYVTGNRENKRGGQEREEGICTADGPVTHNTLPLFTHLDRTDYLYTSRSRDHQATPW